MEVIHQALEAQGVAVQGIHGGAVHGPQPVLQGLQLGAQQAQGQVRSSGGDVRHPAAFGLLVGLQGLGQGV